jgi:hypothetical protein
MKLCENIEFGYRFWNQLFGKISSNSQILFNNVESRSGKSQCYKVYFQQQIRFSLSKLQLNIITIHSKHTHSKLIYE